MEGIPITSLWFTQKSLKRKDKIPELSALESFETRIEISIAEDGELEIINGHHRVTAVWLSGRKTLLPHEYLLIPTENSRHRFGKAPAAIQRLTQGNVDGLVRIEELHV
jgi:hypothetical protein